LSSKIFIDIDEEIIFIAEKIAQTDSSRVILVVPEKASLLGSIVNLKLLLKEVSKLEKDIILVSNDPIGAKIAQKSGVIMVPEVKEINEELWKKVKSERLKNTKQEENVREELLEERKEENAVEVEKEEIENIQKSIETPKPPVQPISKLKKIPAKKVAIAGFEMVSGGDFEDLNITKSGEDEISETIAITENANDYPSAKRIDKDYSNYSASASSKKFNTDKIFDTIKQFFKSGARNKILIGTGALIILFFIISYFVLPSASITISVESQDISLEHEVIADTSISAVDSDNLIIPAVEVEAVKDRSESATTTGKTQIGDKATGEITIFNSTDLPITVNAGTTVESIVSGKKYTLNANVTVEAKDSEEGTYGFENVGITASNFGNDYNTSEQERFKIAGFDVEKVWGKNLSNITGGSTEEVTTVSQADIDGLKSTLEEALKQDLLSQLKENAGNGRVILDDTIKYEILNEDATPDLDQEADQVTLSISMKATALSFKNEDIDSIAQILVNKEQGDDFEIDKFEYSSEIKKIEGEQIFINLSVTGIVTPNIDEEKIRTDLSGKSKGAGEEYLSNIENIKEYSLEISPSYLPSFLKHFPNSKDKIKVEITKIEMVEQGS